MGASSTATPLTLAASWLLAVRPRYSLVKRSPCNCVKLVGVARSRAPLSRSLSRGAAADGAPLAFGARQRHRHRHVVLPCARGDGAAARAPPARASTQTPTARFVGEEAIGRGAGQESGRQEREGREGGPERSVTRRVCRLIAHDHYWSMLLLLSSICASLDMI